MLIRPGTPEDAIAIADVHVRSWQVAYRGIVADAVLDSLNPDDRVSGLRAWLNSPGWYVLEDGGGPIGFANAGRSRDEDASPEVAEVTTIYLDPTRWRRGGGRVLLESVLADLRGDGFLTATLWVLEDNERGRGFYEALGWRTDGGRKTVDLGPQTLFEIRYRRDLTASP
ncbi:MAG: GNAT family N-acetyltransferase [Microthrixaceae bacterium]